MTHEALRITAVILVIIATGLIAFGCGLHMGMKDHSTNQEKDYET